MGSGATPGSGPRSPEEQGHFSLVGPPLVGRSVSCNGPSPNGLCSGPPPADPGALPPATCPGDSSLGGQLRPLVIGGNYSAKDRPAETHTSANLGL